MSLTLPNERVNIRYTQRNGDQLNEDVELPLKLLAIGDYQGNASSESSIPVGERQAHTIDHSNFTSVMAAQNAALHITVPNHLDVSEKHDPQYLNLHLHFRSLTDFHPDALVEQIPELYRLSVFKKLLERLRQSPQEHQKITATMVKLLFSDTPRKEQE